MELMGLNASKNAKQTRCPGVELQWVSKKECKDTHHILGAPQENNFENSYAPDGSEKSEAPFCVLPVAMSSLKDATIQIKVWEDSSFEWKRKQERMLKNLSPTGLKRQQNVNSRIQIVKKRKDG